MEDTMGDLLKSSQSPKDWPEMAICITCPDLKACQQPCGRTQRDAAWPLANDWLFLAAHRNDNESPYACVACDWGGSCGGGLCTRFKDHLRALGVWEKMKAEKARRLGLDRVIETVDEMIEELTSIFPHLRDRRRARHGPQTVGGTESDGKTGPR